MNEYCCKKFDEYVDLGWIKFPSYYLCWHFMTGTEVSYDIPIFYCPFCGEKLGKPGEVIEKDTLWADPDR